MKNVLIKRWLYTLVSQSIKLVNFLFKEVQADRLPTNEKGLTHINWSGIETRHFYNDSDDHYCAHPTAKRVQNT